MMTAARRTGSPLARAFDEARFGPARTLDLRATMPTASAAVRRAEPWLRERQVTRAGTVLIITGAGRGSPGGVGVIRKEIESLLARLKRAGVVSHVQAHTAGSFAIELAPMSALFEVGRRSRHRTERPSLQDPAVLEGLDAQTREAFRLLATYSLRQLGVAASPKFVDEEMRRQFSVLASGMVPDEPDRESRMKVLVSAALTAYEDDA